jgi:hypothetical protein
MNWLPILYRKRLIDMLILVSSLPLIRADFLSFNARPMSS